MAHYVQAAAGNYNAANNYYTSDKQQVAITGTISLASAQQSANETWASNHNSKGVMICIVGQTTEGVIDRSVQIDFYSNSVLKETLTLTAAQIRLWDAGTNDSGIYIIKLTWTSPYAVTSGQAFYYKLQQTGGTAGNWYTYYSSTYGPVFVEFTDTTASAPTAAANNVWLCHDTVFSATQSIPNEINICTGVNVSIADSVTLTPYGTPASSGLFRYAANSSFKIGTDGSPVGAVIIDLSTPTSGYLFGSAIVSSISYDTKNVIEWFGVYPTVERCTLNSAISTTATSFVTSDNVSAWASGWKFFFSNRSGRAAVKEQYTLNGAPTSNGNGTYTVNFTPALATAGVDVGTYHKGKAHLLDGYGIQIKGNTSTSTAGTNINIGRPIKKSLRGISFLGCYIPSDLAVTGTVLADPTRGDSTKSGAYTTTHCTFYGNRSPFSASEPTIPAGNTIAELQSCGCAPYESFRYASYSGDGATTVSGLYVNSMVSTPLALIDTGITATDVFVTQSPSLGVFSGQTGRSNVSGSIENLRIKGGTGYTASIQFSYGAVALSGSNARIKNLYIDDCDCALDVLQGSFALSYAIENLILGQDAANTHTLNWNSGAFWDIAVTGGAGTWDLTSYWGVAQKNILAGSNIIVSNYAGTTGDYRAWTKTGQFVSNGTTKMTQKYIGAGLVNFWNYRIATEDVSAAKVYVAITCQIADAAFYAGTHTKPSLTITYDGSSTASAQATGSTSAQTLAVTFTPTQDKTEWKATISGVTDAGSNGNVDWSDLIVNLRKYGKQFSSYLYVVVRASKDLVLNLATLATNSFITQSDPTTVAAYSGISVNHGTATITISSDHTINEIYDYSQYDLTSDANMGTTEWFTTADGTNFYSDYAVMIDGATLSGTGENLVLTGDNAVTLQDSGAITMPYYDADGAHYTVSANVSLVGAEIRIYDLDSTGNDLGTELAGIETCTTATWGFALSTTPGNIVWLQVQLAGYIELGQQIALSANGGVFPITLVVDENI